MRFIPCLVHSILGWSRGYSENWERHNWREGSWFCSWFLCLLSMVIIFLNVPLQSFFFSHWGHFQYLLLFLAKITIVPIRLRCVKIVDCLVHVPAMFIWNSGLQAYICCLLSCLLYRPCSFSAVSDKKIKELIITTLLWDCNVGPSMHYQFSAAALIQ